MDQIKLLVKDVLHKIQDIPDIPFTTVRMSEITSGSSSSLHISAQSMTSTDTANTDSQNNNDILEAAKLILPSKNENFDKDSTETATHIYPEVVETTKASSSTLNNLESLYIDNKGSHDSVYSVSGQSRASRQTQPKIVMGKRALLRSRSGDFKKDPAMVVHELVNVNERYEDKITRCIGRIYHRRLSRESKGPDDDGTSSNYSASSLRTPDSLYDGKSYFSLLFPQRSEGGESDLSINSREDSNRDLTTVLFNSSNNTSTDLEYDPKKFLKSALGDMSFDSESTDMSRANSRLQHSQSVDPLNGSSLFSKAGSLYSSMRKSLRRACSFREKTAEETFVKNKMKSRDRCQSFSPECLTSADLMRELYVQNGIIFQVSKALTFCRNTKDVASTEYIEAEKILLVASCQKEAVQAALDAMEFGEKDTSCQTCSGTLELSEVIFYLKEQEARLSFDEHFVILVTSGKTVLSSKVLVADKNGEIKSDKKFRVAALQTDFGVSVAIYSMKVDKQHGNDVKNHKKVPCPSTKSFFHLSHNHKSSRKNLLVDNVSSIQQSSFKLWGSCTVRCSDLQKTHFRMHHVPLSTSLESYFTAVLSGDVKLTNRTSGFLTIGFEDHAHLIWNRLWCVLDGSLFKSWNYPSEEFTCPPLQVIDLAYAAEKSSPADRSICPRPKTLCLLIKSREGLVLKYFLSTDSLEEKLSWQEAINFVIGTLEAWNCLCSKEQVSAC